MGFCIDEKEWGLVLGGGGGKGSFQAGVFRALSERGLYQNITAVAGTSVGALNLILFDYGEQYLTELVWNSITPSRFIDIDLSMIDLKEGLVSRDGLIDIIDNYIDLSRISRSSRKLYATATRFDNDGESAEYFYINGRSNDEIKDIILASSAMPIIYEPVKINGKIYKDGGLKDNIPIRPLYSIGYRHFIVIGLSPKSDIDRNDFPDAEFIFIRPTRSLGDLLTGTLDFTSKGAKIRMEQGYLDASRIFNFYGRDCDDILVKNQMYINEINDYAKLIIEFENEL